MLLLLLCLDVGAQAPQQSQSDTWVTAARYDTFHVVLPEDAPEEIQYAAEIFLRYWKHCTRHEITASPLNEGVTNVWLGPEGITTDLLNPADLEDLGPEGYLIRTYQPSRRYAARGAREQLIISGKTPRGTLNGVFAFFRNHMGVRWLVPGMVHTPMTGFRLRPIDETYRPHFEIRESGYFDVFAQDPEISKEDLLEYRRAHGFPEKVLQVEVAAKESESTSKKNEVASTSKEKTGKSDDHCDRTLSKVSLPNYLEWYTLLRKFERIHGRAIPFENEKFLLPVQMDPIGYEKELFDEFVAPIISGEVQEICLSAKIMTLHEDFNRLPFEPANHHEQENGPLNRVRREQIEREIETLARDDENAHLLLRAAGCNMDEPYSDSENEVNARFEAMMERWAAESRNVVVLDYVENLLNPAYPFPSLQALQQNLQWYDQMEVKGVLVATHLDPRWKRALRPLQSFVLHSLMWDPDSMFEVLVEEFLALYYGEASGDVANALQRFRDASLGSDEILEAHHFPRWATPELILGASDATQGRAESESLLNLKLTPSGPEFDSVRAALEHLLHFPKGCGVEL